jgi:class 3 adenylate cyclase/CHASE2 domain-containing sensor protein
MPPAAAVESNQRRHLPLLVRESWPIAAIIALTACLLLGFGADPFQRQDRNWDDTMLRLRFRLGLEPKPDPKVFLVGLEKMDIEKARTTADEYRNYAGILDILTDLQVSSVGIDLVMMRGVESDAREVRDSIRNNGHVVLAEIRSATMPVRAFPFAAQEFPSGLIDIAADSDGVHRRYSYGVADSSGCAPSLALGTWLASFHPSRALACTGAGALVWKELSTDGLTMVERSIPARSRPLNFRSPWKEPWDRGFKYLSADDLRTKYKEWRDAGSDPNRLPAGLPRGGNMVLIGSVATGSGDAGATPFGNAEPLVELHAAALNDLVQGRLLTELPTAGVIVITLAGLALIVVVGRWIRGIPGLILLFAAVILVILTLSFVLLIRADIMMAGITPAAFMAFALLGESGRRANLASMEKVQLRETLGRYFSPNVLKDVLKNPDAMQPRKAELTVLLTDVRNFTTITEQSGTEYMFNLLNDIFQVETQAVIAVDGSMEHFVGDQFLAYWGAPQEQPDAADRALEAAAKIISGLDALHATLEPAVKELFGFGVAIHCGQALFGNKGARVRLDYGILGDIVNGAARIESLTKYYGVRMIITREVMDQAAKKPPARFLDRIRVKGKIKPLEMFEVLIEPTEKKLALVKVYESAWRKYEGGDFAGAAAMFDELKESDKPSKVLADRCHEMIASPPPDWDGGYQFKEK